MDEHNLKDFVMCTLSVAGTLPLSIIITSDEKTETLISAFSVLKKILPENAFFSRGKILGPALIMIDNFSELQELLGKTWNYELLLYVFYLLQQVWRWLHHTKNRIAKTDRPKLLSLFKKIVYANELPELKEFYDDLQLADIV